MQLSYLLWWTVLALVDCIGCMCWEATKDKTRELSWLCRLAACPVLLRISCHACSHLQLAYTAAGILTHLCSFNNQAIHYRLLCTPGTTPPAPPGTAGSTPLDLPHSKPLHILPASQTVQTWDDASRAAWDSWMNARAYTGGSWKDAQKQAEHYWRDTKGVSGAVFMSVAQVHAHGCKPLCQL